MEITSRSPSKTDHAIQDLIKSCRVQVPEGSNGQSQSLRYLDVKHACDELLSFTFHSEDGKLQVIEKLTKLEGNFVVKIIRKGLSGLSKVYSEARTFEEESLKLVELCCSQSEALQNGCEDGRHVASPAIIIDWMVELCDELVAPKEGSKQFSAKEQSSTSLSGFLSKIRQIYEALKNARLRIAHQNQAGHIEQCDPFRSLFKALKQRIYFDAFEDLLDQAICIIKADELLDPNMMSKLYTQKNPILLKHWISLLNLSFVSNWFAVEIAKHDFLVFDESFSRDQPFSDERTYHESLICVLSAVLCQSVSSNQDFKLPCDNKIRLQIFFKHSEVLLRCPSHCLQLILSEVTTNQIEEVLDLLQFKKDVSLLPVITKTDSQEREAEIKTYYHNFLTPNFKRPKKLVDSDSSQLCQDSVGKDQQSIMAVVFNALIDRSSDREQLVEVLRLWRYRFSSDNSFDRLYAIASLVLCVQRKSTSNGMGKLNKFLSQLSTEHLDDFFHWSAIVEGLISSLSNTWDSHALKYINYILCKLKETRDPTDEIPHKIHLIKNFVKSLVDIKEEEELKTNAVEIGLDMFEYAVNPRHYELLLNVILFIVPDMKAERIRKYVSDLLKAVCDAEIQYFKIWNVFRLIHASSKITNKEGIFFLFLKVLQEDKNSDDIEKKIIVCGEFFHFPVNSSNAQLFLNHAMFGSTKYTYVLCYLRINEINLNANNINEHITFLLNVILSCRMEHLHLLLLTVVANTQWLHYPCVDIFEVMIASIAGSISVGVFNKRANAEALRLLHIAINTHNLSAPINVLSLYIVLIKSIRKVGLLGDNGLCTNRFAEGVNLIILLPLPLLQLKLLTHRMAEVLEEGKFCKGEEVTNIMFHLFRQPSNRNASFIDPNVLASHFDSLILPSLVVKLSKLRFHKRIASVEACAVNEDGLTWLMEIIMKKVPTAFEDGSSVDLFRFMAEKFSTRLCFLVLALPLIDGAIKKSVSVETFKAKIKEIENKLNFYTPLELVPLIAECIPEFYAIGLDEKRDIYIFIRVLLDLNSNMFDIKRLHDSLSPLNIPKHIVSVFQENITLKGLMERLNRIIDVTSNLSPSILSMVLLTPRDQASRGEALLHDFNMLLNHTCLSSNDVCFALLLYNNEQMIKALDISSQKYKSGLDDDNEWPIKYDQTKPLTAGKLAFLIIHHLRRLGVDDVRIEANTIYSKLVQNYRNIFSGLCSNQQSPHKFEEYFELFIGIIEKTCSLDEARYWLNFRPRYALQGKNVILAACSRRAGRDAIQMNYKVSETLSKVLTDQPLESAANVSCKTALANELLDTMADILKKVEDEQVVCKLFKLLELSVRSTAACLEIIPSWNANESLLLVEQIEGLYAREQETSEEIDQDFAAALQVLPFAAKVLHNSATKLIHFLKTITEKNGGHDDVMSLRRIPVWYRQMTDARYSPPVVQSWCASLVFSENLGSSEVDAITNLTPETIKFISKETDEIAKCLFSKEAPKTWETDDDTIRRTNAESFKRCLLLARLVNEYYLIAHQLNENAEVVQRIKDGTEALCWNFADETSPIGKIYKSRDNFLLELTVILFSGENDAKSMTLLTEQEPLSKTLILLLRRLARSVQKRSITFGHVKKIVNKIQKCCTETLSPMPQRYQEVQGIIHEEVLMLDENQASMHLLESSGYNQGIAGKDDLWYSSSIQMSAYVSTIESLERIGLERLLRQLWGEWKTILSENNIQEVEVDEKRIKTSEMFSFSDSLEMMESQLKAVKKTTCVFPQDDWSSYRSMELMRKERTLVAMIKRQTEKVKGTFGSSKLTKAMIVWENRLLETIKMCSEKIPGCYAPNGFHSEKPVICGIAVDNRILTLYKQDDGVTRTEVENVEVKLYPSGMFVFGVFRSVHPYETEELWAAFYKMLLDKRLVPKIFITNASPAFDWIKQFVVPETSIPSHFSFDSSCGLIPSSEDSFDYDPDICIHRLHTLLADTSMKELIILTQEKAKEIKPSNIKAPTANRKSVIKEQMDEVEIHLKQESRLREMHPELNDLEFEGIIKRLKTPIRKAVEISVDGGEPTEESISRSIDMKRLLSGMHSRDAQQQYSKDDYSAIILVAVKTVTEDLRGNRNSYDGCEHVVFLQPNVKET